MNCSSTLSSLADMVLRLVQRETLAVRVVVQVASDLRVQRSEAQATRGARHVGDLRVHVIRGLVFM